MEAVRNLWFLRNDCNGQKLIYTLSRVVLLLQNLKEFSELHQGGGRNLGLNRVNWGCCWLFISAVITTLSGEESGGGIIRNNKIWVITKQKMNKQAGAELCLTQEKLGLAKPTLLYLVINCGRLTFKKTLRLSFINIKTMVVVHLPANGFCLQFAN